MRTFTMLRNGEPAFEGVEFSDGTVAIRWFGAFASTSLWASVDQMLTIHGHFERDSKLIWSDE